MSLRNSWANKVNKIRTICEVLREINDLHQDDSQQSKTTRKLLCDAEDMAKRMVKKLKEYNMKWDATWWEKNPDYEKDLDKRLNEKYIAEEKMGKYLDAKIKEDIEKNGKLYAPIRGYDYPVLYNGRFEAMKPYIRQESKTVVDFGAHYGETSLEFALLGKEVTAIEKSQRKINVIMEYCRINGNLFKVVNTSINKYVKDHNVFDTLIALNIFHHMLKTKERYGAFLKMMKSLRIGDAFFQPPNEKEDRIQSDYKKLSQDDFAELIKGLLRLNKIEKIGVFNERNLYYIS